MTPQLLLTLVAIQATVLVGCKNSERSDTRPHESTTTPSDSSDVSRTEHAEADLKTACEALSNALLQLRHELVSRRSLEQRMRSNPDSETKEMLTRVDEALRRIDVMLLTEKERVLRDHDRLEKLYNRRK